jgi:hypothetical protein
LRDLVHRDVKLGEIGDEDDELAEREMAAQDRARAGIDDDGCADGDERGDRGGIERLPAIEAQRRP